GSQLEREPAVPRESFEHVIEKADPGRDLDGLGAVQTDTHLDVSLVGVPQDFGAAGRELPHDGRPGLLGASLAADSEAAQLEPGGPLAVGGTIDGGAARAARRARRRPRA